jgi:hypothetical protein
MDLGANGGWILHAQLLNKKILPKKSSRINLKQNYLKLTIKKQLYMYEKILADIIKTAVVCKGLIFICI